MWWQTVHLCVCSCSFTRRPCCLSLTCGTMAVCYQQTEAAAAPCGSSWLSHTPAYLPLKTRAPKPASATSPSMAPAITATCTRAAFQRPCGRHIWQTTPLTLLQVTRECCGGMCVRGTHTVFVHEKCDLQNEFKALFEPSSSLLVSA